MKIKLREMANVTSDEDDRNIFVDQILPAALKAAGRGLVMAAEFIEMGEYDVAHQCLNDHKDSANILLEEWDKRFSN